MHEVCKHDLILGRKSMFEVSLHDLIPGEVYV